MSEEIFTEPEETTEDWVDVRMTNPEEREWDVDFVVVDGQVNYVDLRIRPELLRGFVACLIDDVGDDHAGSILADIAEENDLNLDSHSES